MAAKKVKIRDREFTVKLPGAAILPLLQLYRKLVAEAPESLEEAKKRSEQVPKVVDEILKFCVEGPFDQLEPGDKLVLLTAALEFLDSTIRPRRLQFFREERGG